MDPHNVLRLQTPYLIGQWVHDSYHELSKSLERGDEEGRDHQQWNNRGRNTGTTYKNGCSPPSARNSMTQ